MTTRLLPLRRRPEAAEPIARWYVDAWEDPRADPARAVARTVAELRSGLTDPDGLPSTWIAETDGRVVGAAQLKRREVPALRGFEHWLGGVYVDARCRGRGLARRLVERCVDEAAARGIGTLHLQTERETVGLYAALGWTIARLPPGVAHERPVMVRAVGTVRAADPASR